MTRLSLAPKLECTVSEAINESESAVRDILEQIRRWQQLFTPGEAPYSLSSYEDLYTDGRDELLIYDNFATPDTRFTGFDRYRRTWEDQINANFPGLVMYRIHVDRIEFSGDLAWSALTWWGSVRKDGQTLHTSQHGTHTWRRQNGAWQIVHEHLSGPVKEQGEESRRPMPGA
ncbi:hypothetical protein C2W62_28815 [Candidatus Entotheonella serta]|nr:hypothetical protein C2W62_28815 [Candidatus Entotheonella serta]